MDLSSLSSVLSPQAGRQPVDAMARDLNSRVDTKADKTSTLSLINQHDQTMQEIARLRGDLEVANNNIRKLQEDNKLLYTNLDERLKKFEPKSVQLDGQEVSVPPEQFSEYQAGLDHFKAGNYKDAAAQFQQFLDKHKQSKLEPQVRYFLGSTQFALSDYKTALITQRDLAKDFPDSPRAPDALLSMASSQLELKSIPGAKKTLNELITKYPDSPAAASAKTRLAALK